MTQLLTTIAPVREYLTSARKQGLKIGCVPTMGALHAGHASLMERARAAKDVVVVTIFVNPIQFDRKEDFERYAKNLTPDLEFCQARKSGRCVRTVGRGDVSGAARYIRGRSRACSLSLRSFQAGALSRCGDRRDQVV